jgi:DNA-binding CsgD family transcriptional regulator
MQCSLVECSDSGSASSPRKVRLSARQREVVELAASGLSLKLIAGRLGISISTVAVHLGDARRRLGVDRLQLARLFHCSKRPGDETTERQHQHIVQVMSLLTETEQEIIHGVLRGQSNEQIAQERNRSSRTVANQIANAFRKLGINSRSQLFALMADPSRATSGSPLTLPRLRFTHRASAARTTACGLHAG